VTISVSKGPSDRARGVGVTAVLGPTNTGKTHLAIERMLAHSSGVIGLPLRLLAREVYNTILDRIGPEPVALVTGEEKIKPANARYWVCTVEAMPPGLDPAFLAVDEIQLGADLERGHVFTDRLLHRRGREETLLLGAATMRSVVEKLLPGANVVSRPRLSQLTHGGEKKLTRLQRRSAIVAFSAEEVYAIAELIRRQRGGAAVVLGALSPRTRNAQVSLYQSGEVDYLVATDAIGMGLNLDVDHVAFASDRKFDGYSFRRLTAAEFAQIAGRAGRAVRNGTFGTTARCPPFEPELVQALESHRFETVKVLQWRSSDLDFASLEALQASLSQAPAEAVLTRAPIGEDLRVLEHVVRDAEIRELASDRAAVERLWEVCQVPDYRKIAPAMHAELVTTLYGFLIRRDRIPVDWFARQVAFADHVDGDIDTLSTRIAHIRTWTFAANRADWLADPEHWQGITRAIEDRLSDALHQRLTERFVDRRTSVLVRRLRENTMLETDITRTGEVFVEGHAIGRLTGFQFAADPAAGGPEAKALRAAAQKALAGEIDERAKRLHAAPDGQFVLAVDGAIRWTGEPVGKLIACEDVLHPKVRIIADERLAGASRDSVQQRLELWLKAHIEKLLAPLFELGRAEDVTGIARGLAFQLVEAVGVLERHKVAAEVKALDPAARSALRKHGVRLGAYHVYMPALLKPAPRALAAQLWALKHGSEHGADRLPLVAANGRTSLPLDNEVAKTLYRVAGYRVCGERAVRVDILERLFDLIRPLLAWRPGAPGEKPAGALDGTGFTVTGAMTSLIGASGEDFAKILRALGYRMERRPRPPAGEPAQQPQVAAAGESIGATASPSVAPEGPGIAGAAGAASPASEAAEPGSSRFPGTPETSASAEPGEEKTGSLQLIQATPEASTPVPPPQAGGPHEGEQQIEVWCRARPEQRSRERTRAHAPRVSERKRPAVSAEEHRPPPRPKRDRAGAHPSLQAAPRQPRPDRESRGFPGKGRVERRDRSERAPDPNSPFAKLAELKAQLEAAKDRR
jgi:ATP-dependent RNA helicase SUPV3L1/SUV3